MPWAQFSCENEPLGQYDIGPELFLGLPPPKVSDSFITSCLTNLILRFISIYSVYKNIATSLCIMGFTLFVLFHSVYYSIYITPSAKISIERIGQILE